MLEILPNKTFQISPSVEATDTGWTISGGIATHLPCNPGTMHSISSLGLEVGKTYVVTYEVTAFHSGSVRVALGNTNGTSRTSAGIYTETILCTGTAEISFYSDGWLSVNKDVKFYELIDVIDNSVTFAFFDGEGKNKKWVSHYSYQPELMIKFINSFFSIKDGALWLHNSNEIRNNFYGVQGVSKIKFYANINPTTVKIYFTKRVEANTPWFCPNDGDIRILPVLGRSLGMASRLKKNNYKNYQGSFFASFMRNLLDSRFNDPNQALYSGEVLAGRVMEIEVTNPDITEAILFEIDIKTAPSAYTY